MKMEKNVVIVLQKKDDWRVMFSVVVQAVQYTEINFIIYATEVERKISILYHSYFSIHGKVRCIVSNFFFSFNFLLDYTSDFYIACIN